MQNNLCISTCYELECYPDKCSTTHILINDVRVTPIFAASMSSSSKIFLGKIHTNTLRGKSLTG